MTRLHDDALAALRRWPAPDSGQERLRAEYVEHLETHPDGLDRDCRPGHLTAGALVLDATGSRVLLTLHAKARAWFHLGGHCEPGDTSLAGAALREATEESGLPGLVLDPVPLQLDRHLVGFCGGEAEVAHLDVRYLAVAPPDAVPAVSEESLDLRWWPLAALPPGSDLTDLARLAAERQRVPSGSVGSSATI